MNLLAPFQLFIGPLSPGRKKKEETVYSSGEASSGEPEMPDSMPDEEKEKKRREKQEKRERKKVAKEAKKKARKEKERKRVSVFITILKKDFKIINCNF